MVDKTDEQSSIDVALARIGRHKESRNILVAALKKIEQNLTKLDFDARSEVIAPILDTLHKEIDTLEKQVRIKPNWPLLNFNFKYSSQIARGIVLSDPEVSDHIWEPQTTKLLLHLAEGASEVVIGGAYSGDHALLVAQKLYEKQNTKKNKVHCFDMDEQQLMLCQKNAENNGLYNLTYHHAGLYSKDNVSLKLVGSDALCYAEVVPVDAPQSVKATTLKTHAVENGIDRYDLIMLDIEGGELEALKGADDFLSMPEGEAPDIIFEVHSYYVDWSNGLHNTDIVRFLEEHGYHVYAIRDYQNNIDMSGYQIELIPPAKCLLHGPPHGFNMVAVKNLDRFNGLHFRYVENLSPKLLHHRDPRLHAPGKG